MASIIESAQGEFMAAALAKITGAKPTIQYTGKNVKIYWQGPELLKAQQWVSAQMSAAPAAVQIDFLPIAAPAVFKSVGPFLLAGLGIAYLIGRKTK